MSGKTTFADCYGTHYQRIVRALQLTGLSRSEAEDVTQDAFVITLRNWHRVSRGDNPGGYAYTVAFTSLKKRLLREVPTDGDTSAYVPAVDVAMQVTLTDGLRRLPERRRAVAVLGLVLGYRSAEIATTLGMTDATARKHLEYARRDLSTWLSDQESGTD